MFFIRLCLFVFVNLFFYGQCSIPEILLCVTKACKEPISEAKSSTPYHPRENGVLGFKKGEVMKIVSKSKNKEDYWGAVIENKFGFVPRNLVHEYKVFHNIDSLISVSFQSLMENFSKSNEKKSQNTLANDDHTSQNSKTVKVENNLDTTSTQESVISPNKSFKVSEGTTIYADETDVVSPSAVKSTLQTALPVNDAKNKKEEIVEERATIPPAILNLNSGYHNENLYGNYTIETVKANDENVKVESKDLNAEEEEEEEEEDEEDEENGSDNEDGVDDEEDDGEIEENETNEINENIETKDVKSKKLGIVKDNPNEKLENMVVSSTQSAFSGIPSEAIVNVVENSVTSKVSASVKDFNTEPTLEKQSAMFGAPPQANNFKAASIEGVNTWSVINGHKANLPPIKPGLNIAQQQTGYDFGKTPQPVVSELRNIPSVSPLIQDNPNVLKQTSGAAVNTPAGISQSVDSKGFIQESAAAFTGSSGQQYVQPVASEASATGSAPAFTGSSGPPIVQPIASEASATGSAPAFTGSSGPQIVQPIASEASATGSAPAFTGSSGPQIVQPIASEASATGSAPAFTGSSGPQMVQPMAPEASAPELSESISTKSGVVSPLPPTTPEEIAPPFIEQNLEISTQSPDIDIKTFKAETPSTLPDTEVLKKNSVEQETNLSTDKPIVPEPSILFNQFSVSADTTPENSYNPNEPSISGTNKQIDIKTENSNSEEEFSASSAVTTDSMQENVELTTERSADFPEITAEETLEIVEKAQTSEESPEALAADNESQAEGPGMFSQITEMFSSWFTSKEKDKEENFETAFSDVLDTEKSKTLDSNDSPLGVCENPETDVNCKDFEKSEEEPPSSNSWIPSGLTLDGVVTQSNTFLYLVVTAVTVLLFTLGHNFIEKRGKTGPLIAKINKLEHELLVASKECLLLKNEVQTAKEQIALCENSNKLVVSLQAKLEETKKAKAELEASVEVLQQELDAATEAGLDLNRMLSEVLTQKGGSETLLKSVENLQAQLDSQQRIIDEMTKKLSVKNQENETLQSALEASNEKSDNLEEQLSDMKHNLNLHLKEKEDLTRDLHSQINQLQDRINQLSETKEREISKLKKELEECQKKLAETLSALTVKEEEVKTLKESMKHLKMKGDTKLEAVFDVSRVKAELAKEIKENRTLLKKFEKEETDKKLIAEQIKALNEEMERMKKSQEEMEQKKEEAEKKLEVLSTYFKEKETQLQKELGLQEALWAQKKGDEKTVYNMMKSLQEEVESYKSQIETLKKEILDQERGLKNQIATLEQKAHENWVAARQAERKLEESKQEMAQLRNKLTLIEKNTAIAEGKGTRSEELNGVEATSPILHDTSSPLLFPPLPLDPGNSNRLPPGFIPPPIFMPPPMGGFIPPPPFLPGDRRPPPLGRMSSPPLNNRLTSSSPADYPFERMSSPPLSPPSIAYRSPNDEREHYRHRTPPYPTLLPRDWDDSNEMPGFIPISSQRDSRRDHKGSNISSEHSSSESLDKSSRHSGRV